MKTKVILAVILSQAIALSAFSQGATAKIDSIVGAYTHIQEFNGTVLVSQKGKILLAKGYGYADQVAKRLNTENTIFGIASITKTTVMVEEIESKTGFKIHFSKVSEIL